MNEWRQLIHERQQSGQSVRTWCLQNGIRENSYYYWLRIIREEALRETENRSSALVRVVCDCLLVICGSFNFRASVIVVPVKLIHIVAVVTYGVVVIRFETLTVEEMEENLSKCCERNDRIQIKDIYSDRLLTIRKSIAEIKKQLGIL